MSLHKVIDLTGVLLDAAVAQAEGKPWQIRELYTSDLRGKFDACMIVEHGAQFSKRATDYKLFKPSRDWEQGGPIIDRERITVACEVWSGRVWFAEPAGTGKWVKGSTPLIAAMRCYVQSKLGDEVEMP
jgi:hypothetical protein